MSNTELAVRLVSFTLQRKRPTVADSKHLLQPPEVGPEEYPILPALIPSHLVPEYKRCIHRRRGYLTSSRRRNFLSSCVRPSWVPPVLAGVGLIILSLFCVAGIGHMLSQSVKDYILWTSPEEYRGSLILIVLSGFSCVGL